MDSGQTLTRKLRYFEEYRIGEQIQTGERPITPVMVQNFLESAGLKNPLYSDDEHSRTLGHREHLVPGLLTLAVAQSLLEEQGFLGETMVSMAAIEDLLFTRPVYESDVIRAEVRIEELRLLGDSNHGQVAGRMVVLNQEKEIVLRAGLKTILAIRSME